MDKEKEMLGGEVLSGVRELKGIHTKITYIVGIIASIFHLWVNTLGTIPGIKRNAMHLAFLLFLTFLYYPSWQKPRGKGLSVIDYIFLGVTTAFYYYFVVLWMNLALPAKTVVSLLIKLIVYVVFAVFLFFVYDVTFRKKKRDVPTLLSDYLPAIAVFISYLYIYTIEEVIHLQRASIPITRDYFFAVFALIFLVEAVRRATGWIVPLIAIFFAAYALIFSPYVPEPFTHRTVHWTRFLYRQFYTDEGVLGLVTSVSATYVYMFILFGAFLFKSGAGDFIIDLAKSLTKNVRSGPAYIAVISSALMGSISGSAVANVVSTGSITIPMMKRIGFPPAFAGAVEAAASTGGQIMPPIMGAAAFIIAQWTGISYLKIVVVSIIPAILYYVAVVAYVFINIRKFNLGKLSASDEEIPHISTTLKQGGHLLIPIIVLIILLVRGYSPTYCASWSILSVLVASWLRKKTRMGLKDILDALNDGARNAASVASILAAAGIVIGVANITAIGVTFSNLIVSLSHGILLLAIFLVFFASLILGMGLPVTASYIMVAVLAGPALQQMGLSLLAAHLIIFWFSQDANVTPPVALAAYAASGVAHSDPMKTAFYAWRLAKGMYIIPILFAYSPILFEKGALEAFIYSFFAIFAIISLAAFIEFHLIKKLKIYEWLAVGIASALLFIDRPPIQLIGLVIFAIVVWRQRKFEKKMEYIS